MIPTLVALLAQAAPPAVAPPPQPCPPVATLPPALSGWRDARPVARGLVVGRAVDLPAIPAALLKLSVRLSHQAMGSYLAMAGFDVTQAGTYRVAAGGTTVPIRPLWIDVVGDDGKPYASTGHGHGPACASITKVVEFDLTPGHYTVFATGLTADAPVRVLLARKP